MTKQKKILKQVQNDGKGLCHAELSSASGRILKQVQDDRVYQCHCERSEAIYKRLLRRFAPRNDGKMNTPTIRRGCLRLSEISDRP